MVASRASLNSSLARCAMEMANTSAISRSSRSPDLMPDGPISARRSRRSVERTAISAAIQPPNEDDVVEVPVVEEVEVAGAQRAVRNRGRVIFETRNPAKLAWEQWTERNTRREIGVPGVGLITTWMELVDVQEPLVSFRHVFQFVESDDELTVRIATLRFRDRSGAASRSCRSVGFVFVCDAIGGRERTTRPGLTRR